MDKRSLDGFLPAPLKPKRQNIRAGDNTRYMHPRKLEMTSIASKFLVALSLFVIAILREDCAEAAQPSFEVTEVPGQLRKAEKLSDFYKKYVDVYGLPVIASEKTSDNYAEYWAETVQSYFDSNDANNAQHNDVNTHDKLAQYDPEVFALIDEVFRNSTWRYTRYDARHGKERRQPTQSVHIVIINNSVMDASIYWMAGGMPKLYRKLSPGQSYEQTSFTGHKWQAIFNGDKSAIDFVVPAQDTKWELH